MIFNLQILVYFFLTWKENASLVVQLYGRYRVISSYLRNNIKILNDSFYVQAGTKHWK